MNTKKENQANEIDRRLDGLARIAQSFYKQDGDQRWRDLYMKIDAARGAAQRLMSKRDLDAITVTSAMLKFQENV